MKIAELKKELRRRDRRIEELLETIRQQGEEIDRQAAEIDRLAKKLGELEATLHRRVEANASKKPSLAVNYSLSQQQRKRRQRKKKSPGRRPNVQKQELVGRIEDRYPEGADSERCCFVRDRFAWRLQDGRAVYVQSRLPKMPWGQEASVPSLLPRSEYGLEIVVVLAFLV